MSRLSLALSLMIFLSAAGCSSSDEHSAREKNQMDSPIIQGSQITKKEAEKAVTKNDEKSLNIKINTPSFTEKAEREIPEVPSKPQNPLDF